MDNGDKLMWKYLIDKGSILSRKSYYGNSTNYKEAVKSRASIEKHGINWRKSSKVKDGTEDTFNGTFAEEPCYVTFLEGTLYTNDGKKWEWYHGYDEPINVLDLIKDIIPDVFAKGD